MSDIGGTTAMGNPVVHFEIHSKDGGETQKFYATLFGWKIDNDNPMGYGMIDTQAGGHGVNGGIMSKSDAGNMITFYVEVPDPQKALDEAKRLGAKEVMGLTEMGPVTMAMFADPSGNVVGVVKGNQA